MIIQHIKCSQCFGWRRFVGSTLSDRVLKTYRPSEESRVLKAWNLFSRSFMSRYWLHTASFVQSRSCKKIKFTGSQDIKSLLLYWERAEPSKADMNLDYDNSYSSLWFCRVGLFLNEVRKMSFESKKLNWKECIQLGLPDLSDQL